jgi:hypothetical protein
MKSGTDEEGHRKRKDQINGNKKYVIIGMNSKS